MGLKEGLLSIEKKTAWSFFGFLLAIIFGCIAIYTSFFQNKNPNLQFILESNTPVLDLKEDIKNLDILYKGINIKKQRKNLSIVTLKIINDSQVNILKEFYDDLSPVKISVENGYIVDKPQVIETSNDYLNKFLNIEFDSKGSICLPKLIIEGQEYFVIKLLLLHNIGTTPKIIASGKIAGQKKGIEIFEKYKASSELSFWQKLFFGSVWIHIIRFIIYIFGIIIIVLAIVLPIALISDKISETKKKRQVEKYKIKKKIKNSLETDVLFDLYIDHSLEILLKTQKLLSDQNKLKNLFKSIERRARKIKNEKEADSVAKRELVYLEDTRPRMSINYNVLIINELKEANIIKHEANKVTINTEFIKELNDFISYLKLI